MKKLISFILTCILLISIIPTGLFDITVTAASVEEITVGGIKYKIYNSSWASVVGYTNALPRDVVIPSSVNGYVVYMIENKAFFQSDMESVVIPPSVSVICERAFSCCYDLSKVTISDGVGEIYMCAFSETAIREIIIPGSVKFIEDYAFSECSDLKIAVLEEGVETLSDYVFTECENLETLVIPKSLSYGYNLGYIDEEALTIYGHKGTLAEELALYHECSFEELEIASLCVSQNDLKKEYLVGTELDKKSIILYATYSFGKTYKVKGSFELLGFDPEKLGSQTITINYGGKQCAFDVCVYSKEDFARDIKIRELPIKTEYIQYEENFDSRGGEIEITYRDGSKELLQLSNTMIKNFSSESVGTSNIIVQFGNCTCSFDIKVLDAINKNVKVFLGQLPYYSGDEINLKPIVFLGENTLTENIDYSLEYKNNINAGNEAEVIIRGKGDYSNIDVRKGFSIAKLDLLNADISQLNQEYYTGRQITPTPTVSVNGRILVLNEDYVLEYRDNVDVGKATIRIIGIGNYCGSKEISFDIVKYNPSYYEKILGLYNGERKTIEIPKGTIVEGLIQKIKYSRFKVIFSLEKITNLDTNEYETVYYKKYTISDVNSVNKFMYTFDEAGIYVLVYKWEEVSGNSYVDSYGNVIYQEEPTGISGSGGYGFIVTEEELGTPENPDVPVLPSKLVAKSPIIQGVRDIYLDVGTENANEKISNIEWESSDEDIAQVVNGRVTLKKSGTVTISATANDKTAKWVLDLQKLNLKENGKVLSYNPVTEDISVIFKNEFLIKDTDYTIEKEIKNNIVVVKVIGINMFEGELHSAFYRDSGNIYNCQHIYSDNYDVQCDFCYAERFLPYIEGDIDGDESVTQDDAVYLLLHTMFGETFYPLNSAPADIDNNGVVNQEDAVYLLLHTMFGETFYPLKA